jgi:hypothetical protein
LGKPRYPEWHATIRGGSALDLGDNVLFVHAHSDLRRFDLGVNPSRQQQRRKPTGNEI